MEPADLLPPFIELAGASVPHKIVDIGARHISGEPVYAPLLRGCEATIVGFEPDEAAVEELNARKNPGDVYLPHAVGDGGRHTLHICAARDMTSLLKPNPAAMEMFHGFPVWSEVVATQEIDTVRLDDVAETEGATFLELDVQGAELMILQNAVERLRRAYVLHIEVEFLPLYEGQPLFSEIELFLRQQGYVLHRFTPMMSRVLKPLMLGNNVFAGMSQIVWSDAIFVRDFMRLDLLADDELIGVAQIAHDCYRSADLALRLLTEHDRRSGRNLARAYMFGLRHRALREAAE